MKLGYYCDAAHIEHDVDDTHPEHPMRVIAINHMLEQSGLMADIHRTDCHYASQADLLRAHTPGYIEQLIAMSPENGSILADPDTQMTIGSLSAAYQAAGCVTTALADLMAGRIDRAFCAVRPPGHHAQQNKAMGFCFLNNVAIAAKKAQQIYGLSRIAIIDFDVHQGNGTIDILQNQSEFLICSSFQHPSFPFSHWRDIYSNVTNTPLDEETTGMDMRRAVETQWLKQLQEFKPQLTIVSAGFDAHKDDLMANLNWTDLDYAWLGSFLSDINKETSENKILAVLEGGYNIQALANSAMQFIQAIK